MNRQILVLSDSVSINCFGKFIVYSVYETTAGMIIGSALFLLVLHLAASQNPNCDYYQQIAVGTTYTVNSPGWPGYYGPNASCRWIADCPSGYNCRLICSEITIPWSQSCTLDRFLVSLSGDVQLSDAQPYCGQGSLDVLSTGTRISLGLISSNRSSGGRFTCQLRAEATPANCRCGDRRRSRIVGGNETGVNEFPSMVGIADVRISQIVCGGVIISQWHVLTAAHCVVRESAGNYAVIVGEHDVTVGDSPATQAYRISSFNTHPQFTETNYDYDVSIVTVANAIVYNERVGPICLPFKFTDTDFAGAKVIMLGWGTLFTGGPSSNTLQKVEVDVMSQSACRSREPSVTNQQICTFTLGKDACQYDSGGPVLYTDPSNGRQYSVGIISFGRFCASDSPGINTRVTAVLRWIYQNTAGADFCAV